MGLRKKHRLVVCSLIKKNNIEKLKDYINDNYIVLRLLEYGGSYSYSKYINFLIYAIENNSSLEMMKFIMDECQYETLNFSFRDYGSPLFYAIKSKKLNIADFLIDNGAIINSRYFIDEVDNKRGIFYFLNINPTNSCKKNEDKNNIQKNFDCIDYILNNDFKVTRDVINELIEFNNNNELKYILNELINCKGYTLQYKTRIQLKKEDQKDDSIIDDNVNNIISIDNETIELAIKKENYEALNIIWNYMTNKDELMLINWIYDCIPSKTNTIKNKIFEAYKDQMLKLDIEEQKFNNIIYFSEIRNELKELIHSKQLNELESYIKEKEISPFLIQNNDLFSEDLLIYAIEVESSFEIIKFIVKQYHSLNYTIQIKKSENSQWIMISPLSVALEYENFKVVDLLLKHGANMNYTMNDNYENILDYLWEHHLLNAKQLNFLLNISNEIIIHSSFLNKLIEVMDNKIINYIFNHYSFNNQFIINLLSYYKNKKPLSDKDLKEKLNIEINKIKFDQTLYEKALHKENYKALNGLLNNDQRDDQNTLLDIFTAFQTIDSLDIIEKFIEKVKNNELRIRKKDLFLMNTVNIKEKRKTVKEMIQHNDIIGLKDYILKNNILLISLNDYYHDLLVDAIENEVEISMIEFIITQYSNLNYVVHYTTDQNPRYKLFRPPLLSAIMKNNFKVADLLQYYGADINYKYHNENILFYLYFYFSQAMNSKNMKYLIYHHVDIELDKSYPYILDFLLNYYIFDHAFIIQLILLNRNNVSMSRKQFQKMILKEKRKLKLQRFSYNEMIINKNFKMLGRFLEYHHDDYEILEALNNCCSLSTYNNYCCYEYFDKELSIIYNERLDILKLLIMNQYIINKKIPSIYHYDDILIQACIEKNYSIIKYLLGCIDCSKTIKINKIKDCMSKIPFDIFKMLKNNYALYLNWK